MSDPRALPRQDDALQVGDEVEVVNPRPTGARGVIVRIPAAPGMPHNVLVRWTDHGWGQVGQTGTPLRHLLRKINATP